MPKTILIYSTQGEFLEQLESCLEADSDFIIVPVQSSDQALNAVTNRKFDAVILDAADGDLPTDRFTNDLLDQHPGTRILLYLPENDAFHPEAMETVAHKVLAKPFSAKALIESLNDLFASPPIPEPLPEDLLEDALTGEERDSLRSEDTQPQQELTEPQTDALADENSEPQDVSPPLDLTPAEPETSDAAPAPVVEPSPNPTEEPVIEKQGIEEKSEEAVTTLEAEIPETPGTSPMGLAGIHLDYAVVIIPRHAQQYLVSDLADRLGFILPQLHQSLGWRMNAVAIRPQYLSWHFSIPGTVTPLEAVEKIRQLTSAHLYTNFPELQQQNEDQDFWAPGYLIMSSVWSISPGIIKAFIDRARNPQ